MAIQSLFLICFFLAISLATITAEAAAKPKPKPISVPFNRSSFPHDFIFGSGSAAYQSEGAALQYGRGPSIWDTFTREHPEKIFDSSNGDVANDLYHRYKSDIQLMKKVGLDSFRFSISWSRVLPTGKVKGGVNQQGVQYYNNFINELLSNGLIPYVTIFHWDLPQALENEYGGFRSYKIVEDFREYSEFLFKTFGDRVKYWTTLNEPYTFSVNGYNGGTFAPSRCSSYVGNCTEGNSATEPYIVAHNLLLSHAAAVKVYKQKFQKLQKGVIGITLVTNWFEPKNPTNADRKAASTVLDFFLGWFLHPITYGHYPKSMQSFLGNRLPKFTPSQSYALKGSLDFLGLNYYTTNYVEANLLTTTTNHSYTTDLRATLSSVKKGVAIGQPTALNWLYIYPRGIRELALYVKDKYKNPPMYITENGVAEANNNSIPVKEAIKDSVRIRYLHGHLSYLLESINKGANVKGYFQWAFFDDFEWDAGYTVRFGIVYIDFKDNLKRYLKYSAYWYKRFLLKY